MTEPNEAEGADRVVVEVVVVFEDREESVTFTWRQVAAGTAPQIEPQDWMVEPRQTFPHPTKPLVYSSLVADGREADAEAWLQSLRDAVR